MGRYTIADLAVVVIVAAVFGGFLGRDGIGPWETNDGIGYLSFAEQMFGRVLPGRHPLSGSIWTSVDLNETVIPDSLFRPLGYPAIIAATKLLAGAYWLQMLIGLQLVLAVVAGFCLYRTVRRLSGLFIIGVASAGIYAVSYQAFYVRYVLADALFISVLIIVVCWLALTISEGRRLSPRGMLLLGSSLAALFLVREMTAFISMTMLPLIALAVRGETVRQTARAVAVSLAPLIATYVGVAGWNLWRSGYPIISTAAQGAPLLAVVDAQRLTGIAMFDGDTLLDRAMKSHLKTYSFQEIQLAIIDLFVQHKITAPEAAALARRKYFEAWRRHPAAMLKLTIEHVQQARVALGSPFLSVSSAVLRDWYPRYMRALFDLCMFALPLAWIVIGLVFRPARRTAMIVTALAAMSIGTLLLYSVIHMEPRYILPLFAPLLSILALTMAPLKTIGRAQSDSVRAGL